MRRTVPQVVTANKSGIKYSQPIETASHMSLPETQCAMQALSQLRASPVVFNSFGMLLLTAAPAAQSGCGQ